VVLSIEDLESLEETLDVLARSSLVTKIRRSLTEVSAGEAATLSKGEAIALIPKR